MTLDIGYYLACSLGQTPPAEHARVYREHIELACFADSELNVASIDIPEHHFVDLLNVPGPLVMAAYMGALTSRPRIRTAVAPLPLHNLLRFAGEATLTDNLIGGRLELGLARGSLAYTFRRFGLGFDRSRDRFADALGLFERLLTETDVVWDGEFYSVDEPTTIMPRPHNGRRIPIFVGAGSRDSIRWAVERGYSIMTSPLREPLELLRKDAAWFREAVSEFGYEGSPNEPRLELLTQVLVSHDPDEVLRAKEAIVAKESALIDLTASKASVAGGRHEGSGGARLALSVEDLDNNLLFGTPAEVIELFRMREALGYDGVIMDVHYHDPDYASARRNLELLRDEVLPAVRA